jgi:hypothetical protein
MFGPPLEMFHCGGTAIVYDVSGHDEYIEHEANALVVATGDEAGVVAALHRLRDEPGLLPRLTAGAARTAAAWPDWADTSPDFAAALTAIAAAPSAIDRERLRLSTAEMFSQYVRAERALQATRQRRPWAGIAQRGAGLLQGLARRSPGLFRRMLTWRAILLEERSLPRARTRI